MYTIQLSLIWSAGDLLLTTKEKMRGKEEFQSSSYRSPYGNYEFKLETNPGPPVEYSVCKTNNKRQSWAINERESKRQRRVAKYNTFTVESKMKSSIRNTFRWFKSKFRG